MTTFYKANLSSLTASSCDYLLTIILRQFLHLDEVLASILGTIFGGMINFLIGRHWVFRSLHAPFFHQGKRYLITWAGNLILNALGVSLLIRLGGVHYIIAKVATSITVALAYNYPIQKKYVFKNIDIDEKE
jgi:membrane protein YqaA with SNARE-associated domain